MQLNTGIAPDVKLAINSFPDETTLANTCWNFSRQNIVAYTRKLE